MNQNKSALDRLKEIEAERNSLLETIENEMEVAKFPMYIEWRTGFFHKILSKTSEVSVHVGEHINTSIEGCSNSVDINCVAWNRVLINDFTPITHEEFEAARTEAINKLSAL